jgi:nucleoporin GLE1
MGSQSNGDNSLASLLDNTHIADPNVQFAMRNAKDVHQEALDAAYAHHENLRQVAERALELHNTNAAIQRLRLLADQEEKRVMAEMARAKEECRLRDIENKARSIPKPAPRIATPPPLQKPPLPSPPPRAPSPPAQKPASQAQRRNPTPPAQQPSNPFQQAIPPTQTPVSVPKSSPPAAQSQPQTVVAAHAPAPAAPAVPKPDDHILFGAQGYPAIIQNLKSMMKQMNQELNQNSALKKLASELRRDIVGRANRLVINEKPRSAENRTLNVDHVSCNLHSV